MQNFNLDKKFQLFQWQLQTRHDDGLQRGFQIPVHATEIVEFGLSEEENSRTKFQNENRHLSGYESGRRN